MKASPDIILEELGQMFIKHFKDQQSVL